MKSLIKIWLAVFVLALCGAASAESYVWVGTGTNDWKTLSCWQKEGGAAATKLPGASDEVSLPAPNEGGCGVFADAAIDVRSLTIGSETASGGTVTFESRTLETHRIGAGGLVVRAGGAMTHTPLPTSAKTIAEERYKLNVSVAGDVTITADGKIDVTGCGYFGSRTPAFIQGPGAINTGNGTTSYAAHGGAHYVGDSYGSLTSPTNCGSSGYFSGTAWPGGGAIKLTFGGALVLDGELSANGKTGDYYTGSGGSIWLTAASVSGTGTISAQGGDGTQQSFGGGGRVAIYLTQATSMDGFKKPVTVRGGIHTTGQYLGLADAAPGTYYLETVADEPGAGTLLLAGYKDHQTIQEANYRTELTPVEPTVSNETKKVVVVVKDEAYASITRDAWVEDITIPDATSRLYLNGYTLHVHTRRHALGKNEAVQVIPGERTDPETGETITGKIEWLKPGLVIIVK